MARYEIFENCFLCHGKFHFGHGAYHGHHISAWKISVCKNCYSANWDGIVPGTYPHLIKHLENEMIPVKYNAKGWVEWPQSG